MDTIIRSKLLQTLQPNPAVRIRTEVDSLKNHQLMNEVRETKEWMDAAKVSSYAWNKTRMLMEYKDKRHIDDRLHTAVIRTLKINWPYRNPLTPLFLNESNRTT